MSLETLSATAPPRSAANNQPAIQAAVNQAVQTGGAPVRIPCGTWSYTATLTIPAPCEFRGDDQYTAILMKNGNFVGISITDGGSGQYAQAYLQGFTLTSAGGDSSDGLQINTIGRIRCARLFISNHGGHGLEIVQGSVGRYDDITATGNAGDGFRLTGSGSVQANANVFTNIDTRGNGGWGFNLLTAMTNMGTGVTCQNQYRRRYSVRRLLSANRLDVYCESNSGPDISFTTACTVPYGGNLIYAVYLDKAPVYNGSSGTGNVVYTNRQRSGLPARDLADCGSRYVLEHPNRRYHRIGTFSMLITAISGRMSSPVHIQAPSKDEIFARPVRIGIYARCAGR